MQAFGFSQYGSSNVLESLDVAVPTIGPEDILVKTKAFTINLFDVSIREGRFKDYLTLFFPTILGTDGTGQIVKVGKNVTHFQVGDMVIAHAGTGTYAEFFKVNQSKAGYLPAGIDVREAATLPLSGVTAYNAIVHSAHAKPGQVLVILGAAGSVGSVMVQVAKAIGLYVIGYDSPGSKDFVESLGVDEFISSDVEKDKFPQRLADIVIDATNGGSATLDVAMSLVKVTGTVLSLNPPANTISVPSSGPSFKVISPYYHHSDTDAFTVLSMLVRNKQLKIHIQKVEPFTLEGIKDGQDLVSKGGFHGKVVVSV